MALQHTFSFIVAVVLAPLLCTNLHMLHVLSCRREGLVLGFFRGFWSSGGPAPKVITTSSIFGPSPRLFESRASFDADS